MPTIIQQQIKEMLQSMTQQELAEKIGCGQPIISLLINGKRGQRISHEFALKIQKAHFEITQQGQDNVN